MDHQTAVSERTRVDLARSRVKGKPAAGQPGGVGRSSRQCSGYYEQREGERTGTK
jgi:hypothetical protein